MCIASAPIIGLVEIEVLDRLKARTSFTALDISNALKAQRYPVRHSDVAAVVRDIYATGALDAYDYRRQVIEVRIEDGTETAQAALYHHAGARSSDYTARSQNAMPPVPIAFARDLADGLTVAAPHWLARPHRSSRSPRSGSAPRVAGRRADGALPIPRNLLAQLGWNAGDVLHLQANDDGLKLDTQAGDSALSVRVWNGLRLRICKTKLQMGALDASKTRIEIDGSGLRIVPNDANAP